MESRHRPGRDLRTIRPVEIVPRFHRLSEGSVLYRAGGTVVITLVVRVKNHAAAGVLVKNTAHVSSPTPDPNHLNNHATATAKVHG